jgi:resuscitation-promoting factor RpfB
MTPGAPVPPPGWHVDPFDSTRVRYWDGAQWTEHSQPIARSATVGAPVHAQDAREDLPWWQSWWAVVPGLLLCAPLGLVGLWTRRPTTRTVKIVVTVAVAAVWILAIATPDDSSNKPAAVPQPTSESTSTPTEPKPAPSSTTPNNSTVPAVTGLSMHDAKKELQASGLGPVQVTRVPSSKQRGTVLGVAPEEDSVVDPGTPIQIEVAAPLPRVPDVAGMSRARARSVLLKAGFKLKVSEKTVTSGTDNAVLRQLPAANRPVKPGTVVRLTVADVHKPAPAPTNCTSGYSPCLAPAYDYDCAGGSGDGPKYVYGVVQVSGSDPYDLDRDGDGYGCD